MEDNRFSQTKKVGILGIIGNIFPAKYDLYENKSVSLQHDCE